MPPINQLRLTKEQEDRLVTYLDETLDDIDVRRTARVTDWRKYREMYEGKTQPKNFPWPNASNVHVPLVGTAVDTIHANMMGRIFGHGRVWDAEAVRPAEELGVNPKDGQPITWKDLADAVQKFMKLESESGLSMDVYDPVSDAVLECVKLGTSVLYNPWVTLTQSDYILNDFGDAVFEKDVTLFDGLQPQALDLEDFEIVPNYSEIDGPQAAPLFGHRYVLRPGQVIANRQSGMYRRGHEMFTRVMGLPGMEDDAMKDQETMIEGEPFTFADTHNEDYLMRDLWLRYQLKPNQPEVRLFLTYHKASSSILRIHPWIYRTPPYHIFRYLRREGRFYAMGIPEMLESLQKGINTSFNQAVDNATVANVRCAKVRKGSFSQKTDTTLYPGRRLVVDNMEDLEPFQLGEVYPSIFQVGLLFQTFSEKRSAVNDITTGNQSEVQGKASTAYTTAALLQESGRRFDLYARDIRRALGGLGFQSLELLAKFRPIEHIAATMGEEAELVERAIGPGAVFDLREHIRIKATSSAAANNKELQRQNSVTAFGLLAQYLERIAQLGGSIANPQIPGPYKKILYDISQVGERLMQSILEGFDLPDIAAMLPQLEGLLQSGQAQAQGTGPVGQLEGGNGTPSGAEGGGVVIPPAGGGPGVP